MTAPVAQLTSVSRTYQVRDSSVRVLRDIHVTVNPGDRIVLFGPSGCGKTTLLHLLALLDEPTSGSYALQGQAVGPLAENKKARLRAEKIGLVFQRFHVLPYHSVLENIQLRTRYLKDAPLPDREQTLVLLEQVGLADLADRPVRLLSGGEQQRVCIARACYHQPALLLADEPTGNLDASHSQSIQALLQRIGGNAPVVVATHDSSWLSFATRVFRFHQGSLKEDSVA